MVTAVVDGAPAPPALIVERIERRRRLTVAFRLLLVLPQLIVLYVLVLVGGVAVVVGWFAALVLGRLPEPIARYLCHLTQYTTRVNAYLCFSPTAIHRSSSPPLTTPSRWNWRPAASTAWRCCSGCSW
jgi:hypothetical protein